MTQKELLYVEDAINHECALESILNNFSDAVEASELKPFLKKLAKKNKHLEDKLLKLLEDMANEG